MDTNPIQDKNDKKYSYFKALEKIVVLVCLTTDLGKTFPQNVSLIYRTSKAKGNVFKGDFSFNYWM